MIKELLLLLLLQGRINPGPAPQRPLRSVARRAFSLLIVTYRHLPAEHRPKGGACARRKRDAISSCCPWPGTGRKPAARAYQRFCRRVRRACPARRSARRKYNFKQNDLRVWRGTGRSATAAGCRTILSTDSLVSDFLSLAKTTSVSIRRLPGRLALVGAQELQSLSVTSPRNPYY